MRSCRLLDFHVGRPVLCEQFHGLNKTTLFCSNYNLIPTFPSLLSISRSYHFSTSISTPIISDHFIGENTQNQPKKQAKLKLFTFCHLFFLNPKQCLSYIIYIYYIYIFIYRLSAIFLQYKIKCSTVLRSILQF